MDEEIRAGVRLACMTTVVDGLMVRVDHSLNGALHGAVVETWVAEQGSSLSPAVDPGDIQGRAVGMAIDIGTTTIAAFFYDLKSGEQVDVIGEMNEQRVYGSDVMSRIRTASEQVGYLKIMQQTVIEQLNRMVKRFCERHGLDVNCIADMVVTGNTVILHLFAGLDVASLGQAPYAPVSVFGECCSAATLGLNMRDNAEVYIMPCVSGFFGGDAVAAMMAVGFCEMLGNVQSETVYMADIGTNGEIGLIHQGKAYVCSTAAGPAFEGAHIQFGMGSVPGAISKVWMQENAMLCETIEDQPVIGICGSGLIDAAAVAVQLSIIDEAGSIEEDSVYAAETDHGEAIMLTDKVYITGKDIREIQLAKAAISAGTTVLLETAGITAEQVDVVQIAGGFGSKINARNAAVIGMWPERFGELAQAAGNAAGAGAVMCLLDVDRRRDAERLAKAAETVELTMNQSFEGAFVEALMFG